MTILDSGVTHVPGTSPYAWPYNGDLNPVTTAVLVLLPRALEWATEGAERSAAVEVASTMAAAGGVVIRVMTTPPGSTGVPAPTLNLPGGTIALDSAGTDGFYGSSLDAHLRSLGIQRLLLVGAGLETSIHSTMRSANDRGYECLLVADACVALDPHLTPASISMIEMSGGIFGAVGTAAAVLTAFTARSAS